MTQAEEIVELLRTKGRDCIIERMVWTEAYSPFILGGDVHRPIKAKVLVTGPFNLGSGYSGYLTFHPASDKCFVVESETGAFVGGSLEMVRKDIAEGEASVMTEQMVSARKRAEYAQEIPSKDFWEKVRK